MENDFQKRIARKLRHIRDADDISEEARVQLMRYYEAVKNHNRQASSNADISGSRLQSYLSHLTRIARNTGNLVATIDPESGDRAVERVTKWVDENYDNGYTIDNYLSSLRSWGRFMAPDVEHVGDEYYLPDRFDRISLGNVEDDQPAPSPSEVLFWDDVTTIIEEGSLRLRTTVMIVVLWATGARPMSEFWELQFGQVDDRGDHILIDIQPDSKTLARTLRIDVGAPYLRKWMNEGHPANDTETGPSDETYLWSKLNDPGLLNYQDIRRNIKRAAERSSITKPANPEHFRASRASVLASAMHVTQRDLEWHFGWVPGSRVAAHYIAEFASKSRKHIALADGADVTLEDEDAPIVPVVCDECARYTPRHRETCLWCPAETTASVGRAQTIPAVQQDGSDLLDLITDEEVTADDLRALQTLKPIIRQRDDLFDRLPEYIEMTERMHS